MTINFRNVVILILLNIVACSDITNPAIYQSKYFYVYLEVNYSTDSRIVRQKLDLTKHNPLITVVSPKKDIIASGRLILALSEIDEVIDRNGTQSVKINNGCKRITTISKITWIAVIRKGGRCSLKDKLNNVLHLSNASAVIILDESISHSEEKYDFNNNIGLQISDLSIPDYILMNESIFINASIIIHNFIVDGLITKTSVLFVSVSFILLLIISLVWLTFYYIQRYRYMHAKERLSKRLANAAKKALHNIPLKTLTLDEKEISYEYDQCVICIDNYKVGDTVRILPCTHIFHKICIDSWLIDQRCCPICKVDILKACGLLSVKSKKNSPNNLNGNVEIALMSSNDLENGDSFTHDTSATSATNFSSQCPRAGSTFLERYRFRYGPHHYKCHCHKHNEHCKRKGIHQCSRHRKLMKSIEMNRSNTTRLDISESQSSAISLSDTVKKDFESIEKLKSVSSKILNKSFMTQSNGTSLLSEEIELENEPHSDTLSTMEVPVMLSKGYNVIKDPTSNLVNQI